MSVRPSAATKPYEHPRRAGDVLLGETKLGRLFEFHPKMVESGRAAVLDLNLVVLMQLVKETPARYQPSAGFPRARSISQCSQVPVC